MDWKWESHNMNVLKMLMSNANFGVAPEYISSSGVRTTTTSNIVNKPSGTIQGDLMVAFIIAASAGVTPTYPAGWVQATLDTTGANSGAVAYKIAGATEPASYEFSIGGANGRNVQIITIRNASLLTIGAFDEGLDNTLVAPSITATAGILLAWFASEGTPTLVSAPSGMILSRNTVGGPVTWSYYQSVVSGITGTRTLTINAANDNRSILIGVY